MPSVVESARRGNKTNSGECAIPMGEGGGGPRVLRRPRRAAPPTIPSDVPSAHPKRRPLGTATGPSSRLAPDAARPEHGRLHLRRSRLLDQLVAAPRASGGAAPGGTSRRPRSPLTPASELLGPRAPRRCIGRAHRQQRSRPSAARRGESKKVSTQRGAEESTRAQAHIFFHFWAQVSG